MPVCIQCSVDRPLSDFSRARNRPGGQQAYCKGCARPRGRAGQKRLRQDEAYRQREIDRKKELYWVDPGFRQRAIARSRAQHAFNRGDILWAPCPCGSKDTEMHHEDYAKPLEVIWLCKRCHMLEHYGPAPVVVPRPKTSGDPIAELLKKFDARRAPEPPAIIGLAKAGPARPRRVA